MRTHTDVLSSDSSPCHGTSLVTTFTGKLPADKLGLLVRSLGHNPTKREIMRLTNIADSRGSGTVTWMNFLKVMKQYKEELEEDSDNDDGSYEEILEGFRAFDKNGDGYITLEELRWAMTNLGEKLNDAELMELIQAADIDGDGRLNFEEKAEVMYKDLCT